MIVYLSGSINGHKDDFPRVWREKATEVLEKVGYEVRNPLRSHDKTPTSMDIVRRDLKDIGDSDFMLVEMDCPGIPYIGTSMEIFHANQLGLDIVVWGKANKDSHWLKTLGSKRSDTLDGALAYLVREKGRSQ